VAIKARGGRTLTLATVGALAASLLAVGGVATASSAAGEVHACVHKKSRYARIVNPTTKCRKTEERILIGGESTTVQQNGSGPQGPQGPQGPKGETGPAGPAGPQGKQGIQGPKGDTGPQGKQGEQGVPGKNGEDGKDGKDGLPGKDGKDGKDGVTGHKGEKGDTGPAGPQGPEGDEGPKGEPGSIKNVAVYSNSFSGKSGSVDCPQGKVATGGGFSGASNAKATTSMPTGFGTPKGWKVEFEGNTGGTVYVICA
jgi:hypothetical protein